jgi:hypothetical protein
LTRLDLSGLCTWDRPFVKGYVNTRGEYRGLGADEGGSWEVLCVSDAMRMSVGTPPRCQHSLPRDVSG